MHGRSLRLCARRGSCDPAIFGRVRELSFHPRLFVRGDDGDSRGRSDEPGIRVNIPLFEGGIAATNESTVRHVLARRNKSVGRSLINFGTSLASRRLMGCAPNRVRGARAQSELPREIGFDSACALSGSSGGIHASVGAIGTRSDRIGETSIVRPPTGAVEMRNALLRAALGGALADGVVFGGGRARHLHRRSRQERPAVLWRQRLRRYDLSRARRRLRVPDARAAMGCDPAERIIFLPIPGDPPNNDSHHAHLCYRSATDYDRGGAGLVECVRQHLPLLRVHPAGLDLTARARPVFGGARASEVYRAHEVLGVAQARRRVGRKGPIQLREFRPGQFDVERIDVLVEIFSPLRAGNSG